MIWDKLKESNLKEIVSDIENRLIKKLQDKVQTPLTNEAQQKYLEDHVEMLFKKLAKPCHTKFDEKVLFDPSSHTLLQQKLEDEALQKIWNVCLSNLFTFKGHRPKTLAEIRSWFEDKNNENQLNAIQDLNFAAYGLKAVPSEIMKFSQLRCLILTSNDLRIIPESLGNLSKLEYLDLNYTRIKVLPKTLGNLSELKVLKLSYNKIRDIPKTISKLSKLENLNLNGNKIRNIPESLGNLFQLQHLDLSKNKISNLPEFLCNLSRNLRLNIQKNEITIIPESIRKHFSEKLEL